MEETRDKSGIPYLDDILSYGKTFRDQLNNLVAIFQKLRKHHIKLKPSKCKLFMREVKYLGRLINQDGHQMDPASKEVIEKLKRPPATIRDLRSILGFELLLQPH